MPRSAPRALLALVLAAMLAVLVPVAPSAADLPIEGFPSYQPQNRCSPAAKPGTLELAEYLQARYPGSGFSGISRSCGASGVSEHKEGRAFDWRLYATLKRERGYAQDFLTRILATDKAGNPKALARRMGIMYVIWNDQIWSSSDGYKKRPYRHSACRKVTTCSTTLRHRDHMHISLTRAGAKGKTSWYVGRGVNKPAPAPKPKPVPKPVPKPAPAPAPAPAPKPAPKPTTAPKPATKPTPAPAGFRPRMDRSGVLDLSGKRVARVKVPATGGGVTTRFKLRKGTRYTLTVAGLYGFGRPDQSGDAVCTWSRAGNAWKAGTHRRLLVNGKAVLGTRCRGSHVYRAKYVAPATRVLRLRLPGDHTRSRGALTLVVSRGGAAAAALPSYQPLSGPPAPVTSSSDGVGLLTETVRLDASRTQHTTGGLQPGATYRVTVSGVAKLGGGVRTNGRCVSVAGQWYAGASIDLRAPGQQEHGRLHLNGVPFDGRPTSGTGCEAHSHSADITAGVAGRMRLALWDPLDPQDNSGTLTVRVQRLSSFGQPRAAKPALPRKNQRWSQRQDSLTVSAAAPKGAVSAMRVRKGQRVRVTVRGTQRSHGRLADATCVQTATGWARRDTEHALSQDPLELWVDGRAVSWRAAERTTCSGSHAYTTHVTATKHGPLLLAVLDLDHRDNKGTFQVTLTRLKG